MNRFTFYNLVFGVTFVAALLSVSADTTSEGGDSASVYSPEVLPGKGLAEHPFLCCGENDQHRSAQTMSVVRDGKIVWTYSIPMLEHGEFQEIGSCFMRPDGNIVFSRMHGASIITPDKKII